MTVAKISRPDPGPAAVGRTGSTAGRPLKRLAISRLHVDHDAYQRPQVDPHVNKIANGWHDDLLTPPTVVRRADGSLWLVDGQQRTAAARQVGYTHIHCNVIEAADLSHESWLFLQFNLSPKKLSAQQIYRASLGCGEQVYCAAEEILHAHGLTGKHVGSVREIGAVTTLREAWGDAGMKINATLTDEQMETGRVCLEWVISAGGPMLGRGDRANKVFDKKKLGALVWIYKNALTVPSLEQVQTALGRVTCEHLGYLITGTTTSAGGNVRSPWGIHLAKFVNDEIRHPVIELPDECWERLRTEHLERVLAA